MRIEHIGDSRTVTTRLIRCFRIANSCGRSFLFYTTFLTLSKSSLTKNLKHLIEEKIQVQKWSPEQVAHVVGIAYKTVYNWIDQGWLDVQLPDLPDHGIRRHRAKEKRGTFSHGRSIEERPHKVETRQEFGHFEADTVLSGKRKGQAVATFVERKSRLTIVKRLHGRDSRSMT